MPHQELSAYVSEQIAQGVTAQTIKEALLSAGWLEVDADNALRDAAAHTSPVVLASFQNDMVHIRHAVNNLAERVQHLEGRFAVAGSGEGTLESGVIGPHHELPAGSSAMPRVLPVVLFALLFLAIGYWGMKLISTELFTPMTRVWVEAGLGVIVTLAGFIVGKKGHRSVANVLTGVGLALVSLATVGAWYLLYVDWTVAVALGALFTTVALVLGRFYDRWARD